MPRVFVPVNMRDLTGGREIVTAESGTVRSIIEQVDATYPGLKARLCLGGNLRPGLAVAINDSVSSLGLLQHVDSDAEIHFVNAIAGG